jgi:aldose 1-epimerase
METFVLGRGNTRVAVIPAAGGRIAQCSFFDGMAWLPILHDAADTPIEERDPLGWGCYAMVPWPNRISGGRMRFEGQHFDLPRNDPAGAIHGLGFAVPWNVDWRTPAAIGMSLALDAAGWPWPAQASQRVDVSDDEVRLSLEIRASGGARFPAGCGWHPWFSRTLGGETDLRVLVDADERLELASVVPTERAVPVDGDYDLRSYTAIGDRRLDDCYRGVRGPIRLRWGAAELTMRLSPNLTYAVVYTPAQAICVEPQTCAIDAFNLDAAGTPAGTAIVDAGRPLSAAISWRWTPGMSSP